MPTSNPSNGTWVRPAVSTYAPSCIIAVIPVTHDLATDPNARVWESRFQRVWVCESHRVRENWTDPHAQCFEDVETFWDYLETGTKAGRRIHVFAPHTFEALKLLGFWPRIEEHGSTNKPPPKPKKPKPDPSGIETASALRRKVLLAGKTEPADRTYFVKDVNEGKTASVVRYWTNGRSFLWCNFNQYVTADESEIHTTVYHGHPTQKAKRPAGAGIERDPRLRAAMWCRFFVKLSKWWIQRDGGPWGPSVASLAYSWLRRRIQPQTLLTHKSETAAAVEEAAIFGGRRTVWYWGNIGTPADWSEFKEVAPTRSTFGDLPRGMVHHDIRSMYPYLLSRMPFPVQLLAIRREPSVAAIRDALGNFGVIAKVTIETDVPEYPFRTPAGVRYPTGRFVTALAGPELATALQCDRVKKVHGANIYALGHPFRSACEELLALRSFYREEHEFAMEAFAKSLGNAMSGKLAQRTFVWLARPKTVAPHRWGPWSRLRMPENIITEFRILNGMAWERCHSEDKPRPLASCYAYLTSYGRSLMSFVRGLCPPRSVLAQDTDGIWTTPAASTALYGEGDTQPTDAGELRETLQTPVGRFFGPQHYWWGPAWVVSGTDVVKIEPGSDKALRRQVAHDTFSTSSTPSGVVVEAHKEIYLGRPQAHEEIDNAGWSVPMHVWHETPAERMERFPEVYTGLN